MTGHFTSYEHRTDHELATLFRFPLVTGGLAAHPLSRPGCPMRVPAAASLQGGGLDHDPTVHLTTVPGL